MHPCMLQDVLSSSAHPLSLSVQHTPYTTRLHPTLSCADVSRDARNGMAGMAAPYQSPEICEVDFQENH